MHAEGNHFWLNDLKPLKGQNLKFKQVDFYGISCMFNKGNGRSLGKTLAGKSYANFVSLNHSQSVTVKPFNLYWVTYSATQALNVGLSHQDKGCSGLEGTNATEFMEPSTPV